jgi:glutathione synthase
MPSILFLVADAGRAHNDNHERLPAAFRAADWTVLVQPHDAVALRAGAVMVADRPVAGFDRIWVLGLGRAATFFDRMQLLRRVAQDRFVTRIDALMYLHAKYAWSEYMPETHASNDPEALAAIAAAGGDWVAKPTAGSFGRGVVRIVPGPAGLARLKALTQGEHHHYCLLQRFVAEIAAGEKRTLIAGGHLIGSYLRLPGQDFRTNLSLQGTPVTTVLNREERVLVDRVHAELIENGIGFAAIDIAYPYLMEVNLANPGGLATLAELYGSDTAAAVVTALQPSVERIPG